jgi:aminoglycoside N3'-acetyltransferase
MDLTAEMTELDLKPGTVVTVHSLDAESAWPIVGWTDDVGIDRLTSIEPAVFDSDFTPA